MDFNTKLRIGLIVAGLLLLLVNIDYTYILSKIISKPKNNPEKNFLKMVDLWYQLKNICDQNNFTKASKKLDEVFPLLNNGDENE
jgi:hypothetical protein